MGDSYGVRNTYDKKERMLRFACNELKYSNIYLYVICKA